MLAAGCEKSGSVPASPTKIPKAFSADAEITFRDLYMTAAVSLTAENELKIKMLTPESLAPLEIICLNGNCRASFDGIEFSTATDRFPQAEFASITAQAFDYAQANIDLNKTLSDGKITYQGSTDSGVFILNQDPQSGNWLDLSIEGAQLLFFSSHHFWHQSWRSSLDAGRISMGYQWTWKWISLRKSLRRRCLSEECCESMSP